MNYKKQKPNFFYFALLTFLSLATLTTTAFGQKIANTATDTLVNTTPNSLSNVSTKQTTDKIANTDTDTLINTSPDPLAGPTPSSDVIVETPVADPLETFNRHTFAFNEAIDRILMKPVATLYNNIMPKPVNQGIHNFYNNIGTLPTIANDILQLNFYQGMRDFWRFAFNTTLGIGGLFDVSTRLGLKYYSNDFGLTLTSWGYRSSTFIVFPFFGPSTIRDGVALPVDYLAFSIYPYVEPISRRYALYTLGAVDRRAQLLKLEGVMEEAALDKYTFIRDAYLQRRAAQIEQTKHLGYREQVESQSQTGTH